MKKKKAAIKKPITTGVCKVPVIMQLEVLECGAASLAMITNGFRWNRYAQTAEFHVMDQMPEMFCGRQEATVW